MNIIYSNDIFNKNINYKIKLNNSIIISADFSNNGQYYAALNNFSIIFIWDMDSITVF